MITRRTALGAVAILPPAPGLVRARRGSDGLAERRATVAYRQDKWPAIEQAIRQAAGFDLLIEVKWDQLTIPGDAEHYAEGARSTWWPEGTAAAVRPTQTRASACRVAPIPSARPHAAPA